MESSEQQKAYSHSKEISKDLIAATIGGVVGLFATHPIDTVRIRMQLQTYPRIYNNMFDWGAKIVKGEGVKGLFKGVISNTLGSAPIFSLCFAAKEVASRALEPMYISENSKSYIAGFFGGLVSCSILVPSEMLKCRAQADKLHFINYRSTISSIWREKGIRGIYQGFWITCLRDAPACGFYFWTYEATWRKFIKKDDSSARIYAIKVIAGGLAGCADWIPTYSFDVIKTKIQTDKSLVTPSIMETIVDCYKKEGVRFFFKGLFPTWALAFPLNAIVFVVYDEIIEILDKHYFKD